MDVLKVIDVFGKYTGLRHCSISEKSGEEFYHDFLNSTFRNSLANNKDLIVDLDGVRGYSPSFIDEAFGNLVYDFKLVNVKKHLKIKSNDFKYWVKSIEEDTYRAWENKRIKGETPTKTRIHNPWWRILENEIKQDVWIKPVAQ